MEWIKNSILNSILSTIFDFSNVNWLKCHEFACSSRVKEACDLWKELQDMKAITELMKICRPTLIKYLNQGNKLSWCEYNQKENMRINGRNHGLERGKLIEILDSQYNSLGTFPSASELSRVSVDKFGIELKETSIRLVCRKVQNKYKGYIFRYL